MVHSHKDDTTATTPTHTPALTHIFHHYEYILVPPTSTYPTMAIKSEHASHSTGATR